MTSSSSYASYIDTATDAAGQSWAAWGENGLIYMARWDTAANRWGDAAAISNATGGRNVQLTAGQVVRNAAAGQAQPALVVTWESGIDNDADVLASVGFFRSDGTVLWSDAVNLLPGGVAENNHSIGISGNSLILATEAQAVVNPVASGPADNKPAGYHDSEINTYELTLQARSSSLSTADPTSLSQFSGDQAQLKLVSLVQASNISNGELITAQVNGIPLKLWTSNADKTAPAADDETVIPGVGTFTLSTSGDLVFQRGKGDAPSELLFTAELIGQGRSGGGVRSYARSSTLLRPSGLVKQAQSSTNNDGYTLSVSTLSSSGARLSTSTVPLTFNASERLERVTAALFAPPKPSSDGSALRDFSSGGRFSDSSLARAVAAANAQSTLARTLALSESSGSSLPGSFGEWAGQVFADPYVLYQGQVNRFGITLVDLTNALTGNAAGGGIPVLGSLANNAAFELGLDGLMSYVDQKISVTSNTDAQLVLSVTDSKLGSVALTTNATGAALSGSGYLEGRSGEFSQWITGRSAIVGRPARALLNVEVVDGKISGITIKEQEGVFSNDQTATVALAKANQQLDVTAGLNLRIGKTKAINLPVRRNSQRSSASDTNRSSEKLLPPLDYKDQKKFVDSRNQLPQSRLSDDRLDGLKPKNINRLNTLLEGSYLDTNDFKPNSYISTKPSSFHPQDDPKSLKPGTIVDRRKGESSARWVVVEEKGKNFFVPLAETYMDAGLKRQVEQEFRKQYQNDFNSGKSVIGEAKLEKPLSNGSSSVAYNPKQPAKSQQLKPVTPKVTTETGSIADLAGVKVSRTKPMWRQGEKDALVEAFYHAKDGTQIKILAKKKDVSPSFDRKSMNLNSENYRKYGLDKSQNPVPRQTADLIEREFKAIANNFNKRKAFEPDLQDKANKINKELKEINKELKEKNKELKDFFDFFPITESSDNGENSNAAFGSMGSISKPYLFGKLPIRAFELYSASVQSYQYASGSTAPASLQAKRFQLGLGVDLGVVASLALGWGTGKDQSVGTQKGVEQVNFSLLNVQAEAGLKIGLNFTFDFSEPLQPLGSSLVWKPDSTTGLFDYTKAYLPVYENASPALQNVFLYSYYISAGLMVGGPALPLIPGLTPTANADGSIKMGKGLLGINFLNGASRIVSQFPFFYTAGDIIFNNLGPASFGNRFDNTNATLTLNTYANGSVSFLNGLIGGYTRNSAGINLGLYPGSIGYQYSTELGYQFAGVSKSLWNIRDSGTWAGKSNFIANTFAGGGVALAAELFAAPAAPTDRLTAALATQPIRLAASGGAVVLSSLSDLGGALADPLANGDLVLSIDAVIQAPSIGAMDANGFLRDFRFDLANPPLRMRLAYDQRALLQDPERLKLTQPWQTLINQWGDPAAASLSAVLSGVKPGSLVPLRIDLRLPKGTDLASLNSLPALQLGYRLDGSSDTRLFATAEAPLLPAMPGTPLQRQESGSAFQLGTTASGPFSGNPASTAAPYIAAFVVTNPGSGYSDTDFVLEEPSSDAASPTAAVVRGRLTTDSSGRVVSAAIFQTASATAFTSDTYLRLTDSALKARLSDASGGSDAQVQLTATNGRLTAIALATAGDGKTALAGSGYLNGGSGSFCQWLNATPAVAGQSARALVQLTVKDGAIERVSTLSVEGQFADGKSGPISLANSVVGAGSGLSLVPLLRDRLDPNLLDDSGLSIGSFQRYVNSEYASGVDLVYTQGGPDSSKAINSSLNLDTPLRVHRKDSNRGWINIPIPDTQEVYTPGVDGYNYDSSSNTIFFSKDSSGGMRSVVAFSHVDLSVIQSERDLYLLEEALLQSQVYASLESKDDNNNPHFSGPQLLSDPSKGGSNSNVVVEPFYAVRGAGVAPVFDENTDLLAAWVHTSADGQAQLQVRIATANGTVDNGSLSWSPIQSIDLPPNTTGDDVTQLSLTYLDGRTPVLSWSLNSLTPYQAGVLRGEPTSYYRLNDLPTEGTLASIASTTLADGQFVNGAEVRRFSSWLDTSAVPLTQSEVASSVGALLPPLDGLSAPQIKSGETLRTPLQQLYDRLTGLSTAHATAFGQFLGRSGVNEQQINDRNNTKARSSWITTYQQLLNAFADEHEQAVNAIRTTISQQFVAQYGTRIKFRNVAFGLGESYDAWAELGVDDDFELAVAQAITTQLGFTFTASQRQSLLGQIQADLNAAVSAADPSLNQPGDPDLALSFSRGAFAELPNVFLDRLAGLNGLSELSNNDQPSGYAADLWVKTTAADGPGSILDNGLYNPNATLPSTDQLQLPVRLKRLASTELVAGVETKGYRYTLVVPAGSYANVGSDGLGNNLSPFNLRFAASKIDLTFSSSSSSGVPSRTLAFTGADLADLVQYRTEKGKLSSFTLGDQEVVLTSFFEADPTSLGTSKEAKEFSYDANKVGLESKQIAGWSLRKRVAGDKQYVDFNYGYNAATNQPATLSALLPAGDWSHVAISYGEDQNLGTQPDGTKVARLFIDGQLAAQAVEDPKALLGYDFNLLPYQLGYGFKGQLDELALSDKPLANPLDLLNGRRVTRYVDPRSASKATFFSPGVYDTKKASWSWQPAGPFKRADYIPSTIPALVRGGPVDMAAANTTGELRGDGQADLRTSLTLSGMAIGSHITGIRARLVDNKGNGVDSQGKPYGQYAIGDGLRYGLDGKSSPVEPQGLIGVISNGTGLNSGANGNELNLALMSLSTELELFFPANSDRSGLTVELAVFQRSPLNRAEGGENNFNIWRPSSNPQLTTGTTAAVISPYYSSKVTVQAPLARSAALSLLDINTGFVASLAQTNEPTLADPSNQTYAEAIAAGTLKLTSDAGVTTPTGVQFVAIANPKLDGIGADGSQRGVIWVLRHDVNAPGSTTADQLQKLQRLVGQPLTALNEDANDFDGLVIVGRNGQKLGGSILWADLDGDGNDELILASPGSTSENGIPDSGSITVISGTYLAKQAASSNKIINLANLDPEVASANVRVFSGPDGSEFGTALAFGRVLTTANDGDALLIGAPGYVTAGVSTDFKGQTIKADARQPASVGAVYLLKARSDFFTTSDRPKAELLIDGDLPGLANFNAGADPTPRRFGATLSLTAGKRDFNGDSIADIAIGIPGLVQARVLKGGIHQRATTSQREADLANRTNIPDVYREGMDETQLSDPKDVQMGGVLLLAGGAANAQQATSKQKVLILGDTMFGDPAAAGTAIASGGDFNNDYIDDLAIGSPEVDARTGAVSLISGARIREWFSKATAINFATTQHSAFIDADLLIPNDQPNGLLGRSLALNGDVNNDGRSDLVIGDANYYENTGRVSVVFGSTNVGKSNLKITGQTVANSELGSTTYHRLDLSNADTRLDIYPSAIGEGLGRSILLAPNGKASPNAVPSADLILPTSNGSSTLLTLYGKNRLKGLGSFSMGDLGSTAGIEINDVLRRSNNNPSYGFLGDINGDGNADALVDLNSDPDRPRFKINFGVGSGFSPDHQDSGTGGSSVLDLSDHLRIQYPGAVAFSLSNVQAAGDLNADAITDLLLSYSYVLNGQKQERNALLMGGDLLTSGFLLKSALLSPIQPQGASLRPGNALTNGDSLEPGQYLLSPNGRYMALMQGDGNLVTQARRSNGSWSMAFTLNNLQNRFNQSINIGSPAGSPLIGSTPGTRLAIQDGKLTFISDRWQAAFGSPSFQPSSGYYRRLDRDYAVSVTDLPSGTTFKDLRLTDAGVLEAKASDGTILFSFEPSYANDLADGAIPSQALYSSDTLAQASFTPIGTAITAANDQAPTLLGLAPDRNGSTQLSLLLQSERAVDIAALYDEWFASFPAASTAEERAEITSFNTLLKQKLLPFDPTAGDAAATSAKNLDTLTALLEALTPNAGSSFNNYVEGRSPVYSQPSITLLKTYGDSPSATLFASGTTPAQGGDVLLPGQRMAPGDYLLSPNGHFMAHMQNDGNFVVQTLRNDGTSWDVSFSLNDYINDKGKQPIRNFGSTPGTQLELRNGRLKFVNDSFRVGDGSNAIALNNGLYRRYGKDYQVSTSALSTGSVLTELRINDQGILEAKASDGSTLFSFNAAYSNSASASPIPADKLKGLRKITGYDRLDPTGRSFSLVDRNGDGLQELLIAPGASLAASGETSLYSVELTGQNASSNDLWLAKAINAPASTGLLWSSTGDQPANQLGTDVGTVKITDLSNYNFASEAGYAGDVDNGRNLSRKMLDLGGVNTANSFGQYSRSIGGSELSQWLSQKGESFEFKLPAYIWQMKSKGGGTPAKGGADEMVLHIGSGMGIKSRLGDSTKGPTSLDGLAISFNEYEGNLTLFWNGERIWQAGFGMTDQDQSRLLTSLGYSGSDAKQKLLDHARRFMIQDSGLHNATDGMDTGPELMSIVGRWFANLMSSGLYVRYQAGSFTETVGAETTTYQGRLIVEAANGSRYMPWESGFPNTFRLNELNKGLQISIPLKEAIKLDAAEVNFNAYGWSGGWPGVHALAGFEFNTDKPLEGANLRRLTPVGDLNGDGFQDLVGLGTLASGWNYDYLLDLPNNNLKQRGYGSELNQDRDFLPANGANGEGIQRSTLISPVIVWGSASGDINLDALTPIVRGSTNAYLPKDNWNPSGTNSKDPGLKQLDNFTDADNVHYVALGDVNSDGFDDLGIADTGIRVDSTTGGNAYILYGGPGLQSARSHLTRFGAFFPETRAKDLTNLTIQDRPAPDVYLTSNPKGFGIDSKGNSTAWINAINLERTAASVDNLDPAFGGVEVTKITGINGQELAHLSAGGDFSGDGIPDLFLTSQTNDQKQPLEQQLPTRYVVFGSDLTGSYTIKGTANSDSLKGTVTNDVIVSLAGNDIVQGKGGMDAISTGPGDDQIYLDDDQFRRIDGGSGTDTLVLQGQRNQSWDFTKLASPSRLHSIESIILNDYGANALTLNAAAVRALSSNGTLTIDGDLQSDTPLQHLANTLAQRLNALDANSGSFKALADFASRLLAFNFSSADLSIIPALLIDSQRDHAFDQLRAVAGDTSPRPLAALRTRLEAIEAAAPPVSDSKGDITISVPDLVTDFVDTFSQVLAFTHSSILDAYQEWFQTLPLRSPETFVLLGNQQLADLIALPASWRAAYPAYFNTDSTATPPADLAFERFLDSPNAPASISDAYKAWLRNATASSAAQLPPSTDPRHNDLLSQLSELEAVGPSLIQGVLASFDSLRLSTEFSLAAADVVIGSASINEYTAYGGSVRLLVPDSIAVVMDPAVSTTLIPTPPTRSSASLTPQSGTNLEADPAWLTTTAASAPTATAAASYENLRISVSEPQLSDDGGFLVFSLHRSGFLDQTTRLFVNTNGYINDSIPSLQGQVVFLPGVSTQQVLVPRMQQLQDELNTHNPYDKNLSQEVSLSLSLLPQDSYGPRSTAVLALNALNAVTPELDTPSRPLPSSVLDPAQLFDRNLSFQLDSALWITAQATNNEPIRFGLNNTQGAALNDIQLLDRTTGAMSSIVNAAWAGDATIYADNYLSPSTDLYFSLIDGGRYDQDGLANGQITLAAAGARTSPGLLVLNEHVLRAPSSDGMTLVAKPPAQGFSGNLAAYGELLFIATDDTSGGLRQANGSILKPADGAAYLEAMSQRLDPSTPLGLATRRLRLDAGAEHMALSLLNDTNYTAVLSKAAAGSNPVSADLSLPTLQRTDNSGSRAFASITITLDNQSLSLSLSSPYFLVPGLEGTRQVLTTDLQAGAGSSARPLRMAWLRVDSLDITSLDQLLASDDLSERLTPVPLSGVFESTAGDILLPLLFRNITPEAWASRAPKQRQPSVTDSWSLELPFPTANPNPLLQRSGVNSYSLGSNGVLLIRRGIDVQATLGTDRTVRGTTGNDRFLEVAAASGLNFNSNLILTGSGDDSIGAAIANPAAAANGSANAVFSGSGSDQLYPLQRDVLFSGSDDDRLTLQHGIANRVDGGHGDDLFLIARGGQRLLGGLGNDTFRFLSTIDQPVVLAGGPGSDRFQLLNTEGTSPGSIVITDFSAEQGDRLLLPGVSRDGLIFSQLANDVLIANGNTPLATLLDITIAELGATGSIDTSTTPIPEAQSNASLSPPNSSSGATPLLDAANNDTLLPSELVSDGVYGLAAFAQKALGSITPKLAVYIHKAAGPRTIGGGKTGQRTIETIAIDSAKAEWMQQHIRHVASKLGIDVSFLDASTNANLDIYLGANLNFINTSTLGVTLANDNGKQLWNELLLNHQLLNGDTDTLRYTFLHEFGHILGLEHPFDISDGDSHGESHGDPDGSHTLMSYTRPSSGWPEDYTATDWQALISIWGLNPNAPDLNTSSNAIDPIDNSSSNDQPIEAVVTTNPTNPSKPAEGTATSGPTAQALDKATASLTTTTSLQPQSILWNPEWRQLDLSLGYALDHHDNLLRLNVADQTSSTNPGGRLHGLDIDGSSAADVVFASAGNSVDLNAGQDTLFSLDPNAGSNRFYGGDQSDRFFLAAAGDLAYGGIKLQDSDESGADGDQNTFFIDLDARTTIASGSAPIEIRDFQLGRDSITLIEGDPSLSTPLPITAATYFEWRNKLQTTYNVAINAAPTVRQAKRNLAITRSMLREGFSFSARDLFADLDTGDLTLVGLDKNPPWLQLLNGKLQVAPGANVQSGTYTFAVAGSDGMSRTPLTSFNFAVDPQVSIGSLNLAAGSALEFRFSGIGNAAVEILVQTLDANDQPLHKPRLLAGQMGRNGGLPAGLDGNLSNAVAGDLFNNGRLAFFLRKPMESAELIPLEISNENSSAFRLSSGSISVDAAVVATPAATPLTTFVEVGGESMLGLALPSLAPSSTDPTRKVSVSIDLFREASFENTIGFYLADALTGAVVDSRTGAFISGTPFDDQGNPSADYLITAAASGVWKGTVGNGGTTTITQSFDLHASLNLDGMVLLPFMEVDTGNERHTFMAGSSGNSDRISHITMLGNNVFGFEDQLHGGDFDHDDMVAVIRSVNML